MHSALELDLELGFGSTAKELSFHFFNIAVVIDGLRGMILRGVAKSFIFIVFFFLFSEIIVKINKIDLGIKALEVSLQGSELVFQLRNLHFIDENSRITSFLLFLNNNVFYVAYSC